MGVPGSSKDLARGRGTSKGTSHCGVQGHYFYHTPLQLHLPATAFISDDKMPGTLLKCPEKILTVPALCFPPPTPPQEAICREPAEKEICCGLAARPCQERTTRIQMSSGELE